MLSSKVVDERDKLFSVEELVKDLSEQTEYLKRHQQEHKDLVKEQFVWFVLSESFSYYFDQLSDFGLPIPGWNINKSNLKLSGTLGYMAPEYLLDDQESEV